MSFIVPLEPSRAVLVGDDVIVVLEFTATEAAASIVSQRLGAVLGSYLDDPSFKQSRVELIPGGPSARATYVFAARAAQTFTGNSIAGAVRAAGASDARVDVARVDGFFGSLDALVRQVGDSLVNIVRAGEIFTIGALEDAARVIDAAADAGEDVADDVSLLAQMTPYLIVGGVLLGAFLLVRLAPLWIGMLATVGVAGAGAAGEAAAAKGGG